MSPKPIQQSTFLQQPRSLSIFDEEDALDLFKVESTHPSNCILALDNHTKTSQLIYVGAFFQFTKVDRDAWNELVIESRLPDPDKMLGVEWARTTKLHDDDFYRDHMPRGNYRIESDKPADLWASDSRGCYYYDEPEPA